MENPVITTQNGKIKGTSGVNYNGENFYKFQGIPYAKPPVGNLRFKDPVPAEKWDGILDTTKEKSGSYSRSFFHPEQISGSEDCLYLNVYTKELPQSGTKPKPVMFYIHGGGFTFGPSSSDIYGPEFLVTEDIVLVVINYRLGLLGFLSFDDQSLNVPGNAAFKDMIMALKWVQNNIEYFNGDKNNVTIFGESAGGAAVHLLTLSPLAKGLVHRAIAQSGSGLAYWACRRNSSSKLAEVLGVANDDKIILNELMKLSTEKLFEVQEKLQDEFSAMTKRYFGYVVEPNHANAFLTEEAIDMVINGKGNKIPYMTGYTSIDGLCMTYLKTAVQDSPLPEFERDIPHQMGYKFGEANTKAVAEKIKKFYYDDNAPANSIDKDTDVVFYYFQYLAIKYHSLLCSKNTYLYRMSLDTKLNFLKIFMKSPLPGTSHVDDVGYLFTNFITPKIEPNSPEEIGMRRVVKLWANFARFGNPTPDANDELLQKKVWKPVEGEVLNYLEIGPNLEPGLNPDINRIRFWRDLFAASPAGKKFV